MMDYYNAVQSFINSTISIPRNINGDDIRYPCRRCKIKKFLNLDVVTMHLLHKGFIKDYMCCFEIINSLFNGSVLIFIINGIAEL